MADFIHCNACFALPAPDKKFLLCACGHLLCQRCKERLPDQCAICNKQCNAVDLNQLNPSTQSMFVDPLTLAKKSYRQLIETMNFQKVHRTRLIGFYQQQLKKAKKLHEYATVETKKRQQLERENQKLKEENAQIKQQLMHFSNQRLQQTPNHGHPPRRNRHHAMANDTFAGFPMNHGINDTRVSLPAGPAATNFQNAAPDFFGLGGASPYSDSLQTSPAGFPFGAENSTVAETPSSMVNSVDNGYNPVWMNNVPPAGMPLRNGNRSHSQVLPQRSGPFQMSHIAAAFRTGM